MPRLTVWPTRNGVPVTDGPIRSCIGGTVIMSELGQFEAHELTFAASDPRLLAALAPWTLFEIVQEGVGTIGWGYVVNPRQQISDSDEHTITIRLEQLTHELTWRRTRRGWQATQALSVVLSRLAALAPGWTGTFTDTAGSARDITVQVTLNNPTVLAGILQVADQFAQYVRAGANADGTIVGPAGGPLRVIQMGQFGAAPTVTLVSANGGDADQLGSNALIRLPATIEWQPNDVEDFFNVAVPFGGGQDTDSLVTLERLWRIVNDPTYPYYGRYGTDQDSLNRTGVAPSLFPEYTAAYPITDPLNPPTGAFQWQFVDANGNPVAGNYTASFGAKQVDGTVPVIVALNGVTVTNVFAQMLHAPASTRGITLDGHFDYIVADPASYATYGHRETRDYIDSSLVYPSSDPLDQQYTERALYVSVIADLQRFAHPHHAFTCTVNDAHALPTRAGDLINVDYQRASVNEDGAVVEMNVVETFKLMKVVRTFSGEDPATDTYTLSNLGRFDQTDATGAADMSQQIVALQRNEGTGLSKDVVVFTDNIDALNPISIPFYIVPEHFQWHQVRVQVDFRPFRGTANTAFSDPTIPITLREDISVPHGDHNLSGTGVHPSGASLTGTSSGFTMNADNGRLHMANTAAGHANTNVVAYFEPSDQSWRLAAPGASTGGSVDIKVTLNLTPAQTADTTTAAVNKAVAVASSLTGKLPAHNHLIEKRIPTDTPGPASILFKINTTYLSIGASSSGTRDSSGAFTSSFVVTDIGPTLDLYPPGTVVPLTFEAGHSASNLTGVGNLQITITSVEELGGLASTFRIS